MIPQSSPLTWVYPRCRLLRTFSTNRMHRARYLLLPNWWPIQFSLGSYPQSHKSASLWYSLPFVVLELQEVVSSIFVSRLYAPLAIRTSSFSSVIHIMARRHECSAESSYDKRHTSQESSYFCLGYTFFLYLFDNIHFGWRRFPTICSTQMSYHQYFWLPKCDFSPESVRFASSSFCNTFSQSLMWSTTNLRDRASSFDPSFSSSKEPLIGISSKNGIVISGIQSRSTLFIAFTMCATKLVGPWGKVHIRTLPFMVQNKCRLKLKRKCTVSW